MKYTKKDINNKPSQQKMEEILDWIVKENVNLNYKKPRNNERKYTNIQELVTIAVNVHLHQKAKEKEEVHYWHHSNFTGDMDAAKGVVTKSEVNKEDVALLLKALQKRKELDFCRRIYYRLIVEHHKKKESQDGNPVYYKIKSILFHLYSGDHFFTEMIRYDLNRDVNLLRDNYPHLEEIRTHFAEEKKNEEDEKLEENFKTQRPWESVFWSKEMIEKMLKIYEEQQCDVKKTFEELKKYEEFKDVLEPCLRFQLRFINKKIPANDKILKRIEEIKNRKFDNVVRTYSTKRVFDLKHMFRNLTSYLIKEFKYQTYWSGLFHGIQPCDPYLIVNNEEGEDEEGVLYKLDAFNHPDIQADLSHCCGQGIKLSKGRQLEKIWSENIVSKLECELPELTEFYDTLADLYKLMRDNVPLNDEKLLPTLECK